MEAYIRLSGVVMPLDRANVDTDAIIPASYLRSVARTGYAEGLFTYWCYIGASKEPDPTFVLNMPRYKGATILLARENFGCGSSREHAPWALLEAGFRTVIAPSFADIFYNNCCNIGILPVVLDLTQIQNLFEAVETREGYTLTVDLTSQTVTTPEGQELHFTMAPFRRDALLQGLDTIGRTLQLQEKIAAYEAQRKQQFPWYQNA